MKYVALLRGIGPSNPNMRNGKLRGVFEKLGLKNVQTVISSGNVLFESSSKNSKALETKIEKALPKYLGFSSTTIIRSEEELQRLVNKNPFGKTKDEAKSRLNVTFLKDRSRKQQSLKGKGYKMFGMHDGAICFAIDLSNTKTPDVMLLLEKQYSKEITTRTWKTVGRILKKMSEM